MSEYKIHEERKKFLLKNFKEFSYVIGGNGDDLEADEEIFNSITRPEEIYFIAENYNWDDGPSVLNWIIDSPYCTKAAALIIFWTSAPDEYMEYEFGDKILRYKSTEVDEEQTGILNLLERLVKRFENNDFHGLDIAFDADFWTCKLSVQSPKWIVPEEFYQSINGLKVK